MYIGGEVSSRAASSRETARTTANSRAEQTRQERTQQVPTSRSRDHSAVRQGAATQHLGDGKVNG